MVRSKREGSTPWEPESIFSPLFVTDDKQFMAMPIRQEYWNREELLSKKAEALRESANT